MPSLASSPRAAVSTKPRALARIANENAESWLRTIIQAGEGCDAILAAGLAGFAGFSAAEYLGTKGIGAGMIPITPTAAFPSPFLPPRWVPRLLNRASHGFVNAMLWKAFRDKTNAARAMFKLPPRKKVWTEPPDGLWRLAQPVAHACRLAGQRAPVRTVAGAEPCLDAASGAGELPRRGEAPIYIGFGSMTGFDNVRLRDALIEAMTGRRVLFHPGWSGIDPKALPDNFPAIGDTPHDWLFPPTASVIHRGGSGTSHSAARAGAPSIVTPFAGDQFFWAERLRLAGVAPAVDGRRPKAEAFASALDFATAAQMRPAPERWATGCARRTAL
jgi:sterol 3beta-glucosyltransferase